MNKILIFRKRKPNSKHVLITLLAAVIIGAAVGIFLPKEDAPQDNITQAIKQESSDGNCLYACPVGKPNNKIIKREIYTLSNNAKTKFADWIAYHVTKETIGPSKSRNWEADPDLSPDETLEPEDYKNANAVLKTDRGHQVPLASFSGTKAWFMVNYLSNITPQKSSLNQGSWVRLETAVRTAVKKGDDLYVLTGPLFNNSFEKLPAADEDHVIPTAYWKVIASVDGKVSAFIFDQKLRRTANYCDQIMPLVVVEQVTELDFFPEAKDWGGDNLNAELGCYN